ncbi:DUF835 domain-containing protein [Thermococcus sp.]|uniref:DUF835 domain-containing protein n=1 Tax=Thermococcus sp. TaxID=35749 RepID=UPI00261F300C|nr:DUF835 domain-containing protein [Thermococcus sp.]
MHIVSRGYFVRDLIVLILSLMIVALLLLMEKNTKRNLRFRYFIRVFNSLLGAFILVALAQVIGVLLRTDVLYGNAAFSVVRSVLLTFGAFFLFISSILLYIPFAKNRYSIVPIAVEPTGKFSYGGYFGDRETAYRLFIELTKGQRIPGLAVTRDPPDVFRRRLGLKLVPVIWISKVNHEDAVEPTKLAPLWDNIRRFFEETNMDKVVLIDCLEYLILENGDKAVLKLIMNLKDIASMNRGMLIVVADGEAVDEKTMGILSSELRPVGELEGYLK